MVQKRQPSEIGHERFTSDGPESFFFSFLFPSFKKLENTWRFLTKTQHTGRLEPSPGLFGEEERGGPAPKDLQVKHVHARLEMMNGQKWREQQSSHKTHTREEVSTRSCTHTLTRMFHSY